MRELWLRVGKVLGVIVGAGLLLMLFIALFLSESGEVAIIPVEGMIASSDHFVEKMEALRKSSSVKAIVIRIESPGGAVAASQEMAREIERVVKEKPVVASMGNVAASGGYYIAAATQKIFANPGTVTGSIGVRMEHVDIEGVLQWARVRYTTLKSGKMKAMGAIERAMTSEERIFFESFLKELHEQFIADVARGRHMSVEEMRPLADGRIYSGADAKRLKLVDDLGGEGEAVIEAATLAGISGEPSIERVKPGPPWWRTLVFDSTADILRQVVVAFREAVQPKLLYQGGVR